MTFLNETAWAGKVHSDGWITSNGGDAADIEPATGEELIRVGVGAPGDVERAASPWSSSRTRAPRSPA